MTLPLKGWTAVKWLNMKSFTRKQQFFANLSNRLTLSANLSASRSVVFLLPVHAVSRNKKLGPHFLPNLLLDWLRCLPFVMAAVSDVFPWSTCPMVPMLTWGFLRSNLALASTAYSEAPTLEKCLVCRRHGLVFLRALSSNPWVKLLRTPKFNKMWRKTKRLWKNNTRFQQKIFLNYRNVTTCIFNGNVFLRWIYFKSDNCSEIRLIFTMLMFIQVHFY